MRSLKTLKIQARANLKAAIAAKRSADALMTAERAWVIVDIQWAPKYPGRNHMQKTWGGRQDTTMVSVRLPCSNQGKTPAWITEKRACIQVVKSLPTVPDIAAIDIIQSELEPLGAEHMTGEKRDFVLEGDGWESRLEEGLMTVVYGAVKYRDIFSNERQTTFAWRITLDNELERLEGYSEYNECK